MDKTCCDRKRTFKGMVSVLPGNFGIRDRKSAYSKIFTVEATSREEAQEKIKRDAVIFLRVENLLQVNDFTETTP